MENLLNKINPKILLGKKIDYKTEKYFDDKQPQYTIVAAFFDKQNSKDVLKIAMIDTHDANKDKKHKKELKDILMLKNSKKIYNAISNCEYLKCAKVSVFNPLMISQYEDYDVEIQSNYDHISLLKNFEYIDEIRSFSDYFNRISDLQEEFIKLFAKEDVLGKEYVEQFTKKVKCDITTNFQKRIDCLKRDISKYEHSIQQAKEFESSKDLSEISNLKQLKNFEDVESL